MPYLHSETRTGYAGEVQTELPGTRGAVLGVVLVVLVIVSTVGSGLIALSGSGALEVSKAISATQAFWAAEAGLERTKALISKSPVTALELLAAFDETGALTGTIDDHGYTVTFRANAGTNFNYQVTSTGTSSGAMTRQVEMNAWLQSITKYLNAWNLGGKAPGYPMRFHDGDVLDGDGVGEAFYNGRLNIEGYPTFEIPVFSTSDRISFQLPHRTEDDGTVFRQGLTMNVDTLDFLSPHSPHYIDFMGDVRNAAGSGGLFLNGNYEITFLQNGTLQYQAVNAKGKAVGALQTYDLSIGNGAIYVNGDVSVQGEVRGAVTLAARDDMVLMGDVTYASATAANHSDVGFNKMAVTDTLGLIAGDNVVFSELLAEINIHASIIVTEGSWGRFRPTGKFTGAINLFGGITQFTGGGNHPQWSGVKNYLYDTRTLTAPPPYYPLSGYEYSGWRQTR